MTAETSGARLKKRVDLVLSEAALHANALAHEIVAVIDQWPQMALRARAIQLG